MKFSLKYCGFAIMLLAASATMSSCVGTVITGHEDDYTRLPKEQIEVAAFKEIISEGPCDIHYTQGEKRVTLYCNKKLRKYFTVETRDSTLHISFESGVYIFGDVHAVLEVSSPEIRKIGAAGSGDIELRGVKAPSLDMCVSGSGDIDLTDIDCGELTAATAGSGDIDIEGIVFRKCVLTISGSGDIEVERCDGDVLEASTAGSGDISVKGTAQSARLEVSGSGDISIKGFNCGSLTTNVGGVGEIIK